MSIQENSSTESLATQSSSQNPVPETVTPPVSQNPLSSQQTSSLGDQSTIISGSKKIQLILGLLLICIVGLSILQYFLAVFPIVKFSGLFGFIGLFLGLLLLPLGWLFTKLMRKLNPVLTTRTGWVIWLSLLAGGIAGYYYTVFLQGLFIRNAPPIVTPIFLFFDNLTQGYPLVVLSVTMIAFGYVGDFLARILFKSWSKKSLKVFVGFELFAVFLILITFVVVPILANHIQLAKTKEIVLSLKFSSFQDSIVKDPNTKVKKLVITADLFMPESGFYKINNNLYNKEVPEKYTPEGYLNYAKMSLDNGRVEPSNFYGANLVKGVHRIRFERSFEDLPFQKVANRPIFLQVLIWKGQPTFKRIEVECDKGFIGNEVAETCYEEELIKQFEYVYKTKAYSLADYQQ